MTRRRSKETWKRLVAMVEAGRRVADVAREHDVNRKTLAWWKYRLGDERRDSADARSEFLPVVVRDATPPLHSASGIVLEFGDLRVRVEAGTHPGYVALVGVHDALIPREPGSVRSV